MFLLLGLTNIKVKDKQYARIARYLQDRLNIKHEGLTGSVSIDSVVDLGPGTTQSVCCVGVAVVVGNVADGVNDLVLGAVRVQVELYIG